MTDVGRPTVMTPEVLAKLEEVFSIGGTDREACLIANISQNALYDYCNENPDFSKRKEELKDMPKYTARKNIVNKINTGDVPVSQWYTERKVKDEFSLRNEFTGKDGEKLTVNIISYKDANNSDTIPVSSEELSVGTTESTSAVQDSSTPQTSGEVQDSIESTSTENTA